MTKEELEIVRLNARILALESVVAMILSASTRSEIARQSALETLDQLPEILGKTAHPGRTPEYSDLMAAELQDAAEGLVSFLKSHLDESNTNR